VIRRIRGVLQLFLFLSLGCLLRVNVASKDCNKRLLPRHHTYRVFPPSETPLSSSHQNVPPTSGSSWCPLTHPHFSRHPTYQLLHPPYVLSTQPMIPPGRWRHLLDSPIPPRGAPQVSATNNLGGPPTTLDSTTPSDNPPYKSRYFPYSVLSHRETDRQSTSVLMTA